MDRKYNRRQQPANTSMESSFNASGIDDSSMAIVQREHRHPGDRNPLIYNRNNMSYDQDEYSGDERGPQGFYRPPNVRNPNHPRENNNRQNPVPSAQARPPPNVSSPKSRLQLLNVLNLFKRDK